MVKGERISGILKEVADFWVSRVVKNSDGSYSIKNVVGANDFAANIDVGIYKTIT
jgi:trehalose/maltose hydrolase-like predicted phosphorylase